MKGIQESESTEEIERALKFAQSWVQEHTIVNHEEQALYPYAPELDSALGECVRAGFLQKDPQLIAGVGVERAAEISKVELEFFVWLSQWNLAAEVFATSLDRGYTSLDQIQRALSSAEDISTFIGTWTSACKFEPFTTERIRSAILSLNSFRQEYANTYQAVLFFELRHRQMIEFCMKDQELGFAYKRGILRTERWRKRRFVVREGRLRYSSKSDQLGYTSLRNAVLREAEAQPECDKEFCMDLYVELPVKRVFLLAFKSRDDIARWKRAVAMHRHYLSSGLSRSPD
eukprot:TRINITY_DN1740_c0_g8_i1.p2 TRINITY_DN1740_c0_g8~~TRINITY_DN1740_c0_g8_i1.p2  ORF type:complete len:288 (-),score=40.92 TRINITY_DN1740_c0_g8_i1:1240-2103(-)